MKKIILLIWIIGILLVSGCKSSYRDCFDDCKDVNKFDFQYEDECLTVWGVLGTESDYGTYPCNLTNDIDLEYLCHYECLTIK